MNRETDELSDELSIRGIECYGHHGVFDHEKRDGQTFVVDLTLGIDTAPAAATDDLRDTVDYGSLVAAVKHAVEVDPVDLIETLAEAIAREVLGANAAVDEVTVRVRKPGVELGGPLAYAGVEIRRRREGGG